MYKIIKKLTNLAILLAIINAVAPGFLETAYSHIKDKFNKSEYAIITKEKTEDWAIVSTPSDISVSDLTK
jgi:archaellum component FlaG (FlaF/FlaG flagellin family)